MRSIYLKLVQLTGVGKFSRVVKHELKDIPIAIETPNTLKVYVNGIKEIFTNPSAFYKRNVTDYEDIGETRFFAIDSVKNVKKYAMAHEIGHKVFFDSRLHDKEKRLKELYFRTVEDKSIERISGYAKFSADHGDFQEFFAEIFAMWARKDVNLLGYVSDFVEEVLE